MAGAGPGGARGWAGARAGAARSPRAGTAAAGLRAAVAVVPLRGRALAARAGEAGEGKEADEFLASGIGSFVSKLSELAASSPLNQGKIMLVKATAGDYDVAATQARLQEIIDGDKVVMFSFTT